LRMLMTPSFAFMVVPLSQVSLPSDAFADK
jgi:hypothetical protein